MTLRRLLPFDSALAALIAAAALLGGSLVGALIAADVSLGVGLLVALCYTPLALLNLPVALALWVSLVFVESHPAVSVGPSAAAILIALAWVGTLGARRERIAAVMAPHRKLFAAGALLVIWLTLSALWATDPAMVAEDVWQWYVIGATVVVVATTVTTPRQLLLVLVAFVAGATLSVLLGVTAGALSPDAGAVETATSSEGRLQGGGGDPNYLAAGLIPAIVLAGALLGRARDPIVRWSFVVSIALLVIGLAATQSRGGMVAGAIALVAALAFYHRRGPVVAGVAVMLLLAGGWFATTPGAFERVTTFDGGGTGRSELWGIAWQLFEENPVQGVGLNNFRAEAYRYVRQPGNLEFVNLISETPRIVHNAYLQLLAENGLAGLLLYLVVVLGCLRAAWRAAHHFEHMGELPLAAICRALIVAATGMLGASLFISNPTDTRLWVLLALGPALHAMSNRMAAERQLR